MLVIVVHDAPSEPKPTTRQLQRLGPDALEAQRDAQGYALTAVLAGATAATYTLASAQLTDAGSYTVVVTNSVSSVTSAAATLTVTSSAPVITREPASITVSAGATASFSVVANGAPPLTYDSNGQAKNICDVNAEGVEQGYMMSTFSPPDEPTVWIVATRPSAIAACLSPSSSGYAAFQASKRACNSGSSRSISSSSQRASLLTRRSLWSSRKARRSVNWGLTTAWFGLSPNGSARWAISVPVAVS